MQRKKLRQLQFANVSTLVRQHIARSSGAKMASCFGDMLSKWSVAHGVGVLRKRPLTDEQQKYIDNAIGRGNLGKRRLEEERRGSASNVYLPPVTERQAKIRKTLAAKAKAAAVVAQQDRLMSYVSARKVWIVKGLTPQNMNEDKFDKVGKLLCADILVVRCLSRIDQLVLRTCAITQQPVRILFHEIWQLACWP